MATGRQGRGAPRGGWRPRAATWASRLLALLLAATLCAGCELIRASRSVRVLGGLCELRGNVVGQWPPEVLAYALAFQRTGATWTPLSHRTLHAPGPVDFLFDPGDYLVFAFVDLDGDRAWDPGEPAARSGPLTLAPRRPLGGLELRLGLLSGRPELPLTLADLPLVTRELVPIRRGDLARLDDDRFSTEAASEGFFRFAEFALRHGMGVSFLEPYDSARTPVLFVHGAASTPRLMARMIAGLDPRRYQAWIYQYPSGAPLKLSSLTLARILCDLQARLGFRSLTVVAHSMGGLVARDAINRLGRSEPAPFVDVLITLSTPFGGVAPSASGVRRAPLVLPCSVDLAPGSPFLTALVAAPPPPGLRHHLLFSYEGGGSSAHHTDGGVTIESQLPAALQARAASLRGFATDHDAILGDDGAVAEVQRLLELP